MPIPIIYYSQTLFSEVREGKFYLGKQKWEKMQKDGRIFLLNSTASRVFSIARMNIQFTNSRLQSYLTVAECWVDAIRFEAKQIHWMGVACSNESFLNFIHYKLTIICSKSFIECYRWYLTRCFYPCLTANYFEKKEKTRKTFSISNYIR